MKRPIVLLSLALAAVFVAACTPSTDPTVVPGTPSLTQPPGETPDPGSGTPAPSAPPAGSSVVRAYFYLGGPQRSEGFVPVLREIPVTEAAARDAMDALLAGPQGTELEATPAITSAIPAGTRLLGLSITNGIATVDLSREFEAGGGSRSAFGRLGQVVYTLTQFPTVKSVVFQIEGKTVTVFGSEGIALSGPLARDDKAFEDFLPSIFVDRPAWGAAIGNPARVTGNANVFEAQFLITLLDASGAKLFEGPVMAKCGSGCRGTFELTIEYVVDRGQWGTLRAWNASARDGSPEDIREYPVWLTPKG
ncbi:MAG: GerMN domain-containing protein [Chloroflexota bacterium]|nr:GerMN domain-containing protein [Chloroflexota bacterium]